MKLSINRKHSRRGSRKSVRKHSSKHSRKNVRKHTSRKASRKLSMRKASRKHSRKHSRKASRKLSMRKASRKTFRMPTGRAGSPIVISDSPRASPRVSPRRSRSRSRSPLQRPATPRASPRVSPRASPPRAASRTPKSPRTQQLLDELKRKCDNDQDPLSLTDFADMTYDELDDIIPIGRKRYYDAATGRTVPQPLPGQENNFKQNCYPRASLRGLLNIPDATDPLNPTHRITAHEIALISGNAAVGGGSPVGGAYNPLVAPFDYGIANPVDPVLYELNAVGEGSGNNIVNYDGNTKNIFNPRLNQEVTIEVEHHHAGGPRVRLEFGRRHTSLSLRLSIPLNIDVIGTPVTGGSTVNLILSVWQNNRLFVNDTRRLRIRDRELFNRISYPEQWNNLTPQQSRSLLYEVYHEFELLATRRIR